MVLAKSFDAPAQPARLSAASNPAARLNAAKNVFIQPTLARFDRAPP
jgi:hypothetical protein